jgi:hypothetical protein
MAAAQAPTRRGNTRRARVISLLPQVCHLHTPDDHSVHWSRTDMSWPPAPIDGTVKQRLGRDEGRCFSSNEAAAWRWCDFGATRETD